MGACTIKNDFVPDSLFVKARAAIHSLRFARDMGFSCVELEGDARSIIRKLSGSDRVLGLIIADGKALSGFLQRCQFTFIPREGNQVAHCQAKHGFTLDSENFWIEDVLAQARGVMESHRWWVDLSN
ncbi:hypothetical protein Gorai_015012 [Gossypium raimondii]|uniref:RNase H type-1 domain-containing protein n=1 Tax=Gossypium raimondii TaxID=29730 RepID=A0A7J8P4L0_GOSRA|nr:hypothetical protein [Gossypium raimondii]